MNLVARFCLFHFSWFLFNYFEWFSFHFFSLFSVCLIRRLIFSYFLVFCLFSITILNSLRFVLFCFLLGKLSTYKSIGGKIKTLFLSNFIYRFCILCFCSFSSFFFNLFLFAINFIVNIGCRLTSVTKLLLIYISWEIRVQWIMIYLFLTFWCVWFRVEFFYEKNKNTSIWLGLSVNFVLYNRLYRDFIFSSSYFGQIKYFGPKKCIIN